MTVRDLVLEAEIAQLRAQIATWEQAFGTPDLFTTGRDRDLLHTREALVRTQKENQILSEALTDGMCNLKLARRIHRDLAHCIDRLPHNEPSTVDTFRERLESYAPFLGDTSNYRVHMSKPPKDP